MDYPINIIQIINKGLIKNISRILNEAKDKRQSMSSNFEILLFVTKNEIYCRLRINVCKF